MNHNNINDPTNKEVIGAISAFSDKVDEQFSNLKLEFKKEIADTKDYMAEKIADLRGDIILTMRGEDKKVLALVDMLKEKKILSDDEVKKILIMGPFPQLAI